MNGIFKITVGIGLLTVVLGGVYFGFKTLKYAKEDVPEAVDIRMISDEAAPLTTETAEIDRPSDVTGTTESTEEAQITDPALAEELNLKMTFYSQAPFGNWDYPWQEACEEASLLLVANEYFQHGWTADEFNDELLKLVDWEVETFGDYVHTDVKQNLRILDEYLGLKALVYENPSYEDIQKVLNRGHFVILPLSGKRLGNPFFKNGGPMYHVIVVKGYKPTEKLITHDVGTRMGEDYVYSWNTIENALHDYAEPIEDGAKRMIEVIPPSA